MAEQFVLLVEDEETIALALEYMIRKRGYRCQWVNNGDDAVKAIEDGRPDAVILDVMLPGRNGYELCQLIRGMEGLRHTRVVMITARAGAFEREKCLAIGADDFLSKPFSAIELTNRVAALLRGEAAHG